MNSTKIICLTLLTATLASPASAVTLTIADTKPGVFPGDPVELELRIDGLKTGGAPSLGVFDIDVGFDFSILQFDKATFGGAVSGDQLDVLGLGSITSIDASAKGVVNFFELSLDTAGDLDALQLDSFVLGTFFFKSIGPGKTPITLSINSVGDALGDPLTIDSVKETSVEISRINSVPDFSSSATLLGTAAIFLTVSERFRRRSS